MTDKAKKTQVRSRAKAKARGEGARATWMPGGAEQFYTAAVGPKH